MVSLFDHEEVGSNSAQGAGSPAMFDALKRVTLSFGSNSSQVNMKQHYVLTLYDVFFINEVVCLDEVFEFEGRLSLT